VNPGAGAILCRAAGNQAQIIAKEDNYVNVKLPSGEVKRIADVCVATIGVIGNIDKRNVVLGKAGKMRHLGRRPHVRGVAMGDPHRDHPHAGNTVLRELVWLLRYLPGGGKLKVLRQEKDTKQITL